MSEPFIREWRLYIDDMISFAEKVITNSSGLDQPGFVASGINYDATLRNLELIGEAATRIPTDIRVTFPEIPWRMIIAVRNRLIHGYPASKRYAGTEQRVWSLRRCVARSESCPHRSTTATASRGCETRI